jgi:glucoamylase
MPHHAIQAPGHPGLPPRWTSSAKAGLGTARNTVSHVWFTLSHGIFNEIYFGHVDRACVRDMGLIVTDGAGFFSEEKRNTTSQLSFITPGVPAYRLANTCHEGRYRIEKEVVTDPHREVVLQWTRFVPTRGTLSDYHLYVMIAPHLGNRGWGNSGWLGDFKGIPVLYAYRDHLALALASSVPWLHRSVGFVGASDGWQDLAQHRTLTWHYERADNGNVAMVGEIDLQVADGEFVLALGFGHSTVAAAHRAIASLHDGFDSARADYIKGWQAWQEPLLHLDAEDPGPRDLYRVSTAVLRMHEAKHFPGGTIASLSIPWGNAKGDEDLGGYHLVWPRDQVETAGGMLAAGANEDARRVLYYLRTVQEDDGHWPQNLWLDGTPYWNGIQLDETALPILLVDLCRRHHAIDDKDLQRLCSMVRRAAGFIVRNGPVTQEDRWEEDAGYSPFTLAAEIAALLVAADLVEIHHQTGMAHYLRETADAWNAAIESWTYVTGTDLARQVGVEGYYVRISPPEIAEAGSLTQGYVPIKNRPVGKDHELAEHIISPDALSLVRFGLRDAHNPRIVNTVKVIDTLLKVDLPGGPCWRRYNNDGYGEHEDGSPFDGTGVGRPWPLLTGERAHYELAARRPDEARRLLRAIEAFANDGGLIPEQIWDGPDIPERELFTGRPSGSAMPLVWAHAEYIKLRRSLRDGHIFDMPPQTYQRYVVEQRSSPFAIWRFNHKARLMSAGKILRIEGLSRAVLHWSVDGWRTCQDTPTRDSGLGIHFADLPTQRLPLGSRIDFTFYWPDENKWEGRDFQVTVADP